MEYVVLASILVSLAIALTHPSASLVILPTSSSPILATPSVQLTLTMIPQLLVLYAQHHVPNAL